MDSQKREMFYVEQSIQDLMDFCQCMDHEALATKLLASPHRAQVTTTLQAIQWAPKVLQCFAVSDCMQCGALWNGNYT
jgi:hypothetical protein